MSVTAGIDIKLHNLQMKYVDLIKLLLENGWGIEKGICAYLPLRDGENFNWQSNIGLSDKEVLDIINQKEDLKELIGLSLIWRNTNIGGTLLLSDELSFSMNINTSRLETEYGLTDFSWYLEKIIPIFNKHNIQFEGVECTHYT